MTIMTAALSIVSVLAPRVILNPLLTATGTAPVNIAVAPFLTLKCKLISRITVVYACGVADSVTLYDVNGLAGAFVLKEGGAGHFELTGLLTLDQLKQSVRQFPLARPPSQVPIDPRFGCSDCAEITFERWTSGRYEQIQGDSEKGDPLTDFTGRFFEAAGSRL